MENQLEVKKTGWDLDESIVEKTHSMKGSEIQALYKDTVNKLSLKDQKLLAELFREWEAPVPSFAAVAKRVGCKAQYIYNAMGQDNRGNPRPLKRAYTCLVLCSDMTPAENNYNLRWLTEHAMKEKKLDTARQCIKMAMDAAGQFEVKPKTQNVNIINISVGERKILLGDMSRGKKKKKEEIEDAKYEVIEEEE